MPKKVLLQLIHDICGFRPDNGQYRQARRKLNQIISDRLIRKSYINNIEVYNKAI